MCGTLLPVFCLPLHPSCFYDSPTMIYTYYYGVLCHGCQRFVSIRKYQTNVLGGHVDVTWENSMRVDCQHPDCRKAGDYLATEVVYSLESGEMVHLR